MIKRYHEAPKSIFESVQKLTDGDYALVHLFEEDPEYFNLFKDAVNMGREVILDNSIFELGKAFDPERFVYWINELKPTYYIVPDVLEDAYETIVNMTDWMLHYKNRVTCGAKMIGVVQGKSYVDLKGCYQFMTETAKVDKVAISFDYSYYEESVPHPNKLMSWVLGRVKFLEDLRKDRVLRKDIPHHLLGCGLPCEGLFYNEADHKFIDSVDTSNPVVHGLKNKKYDGPFGLTTKDSQKLFTLINADINDSQYSTTVYNILEFKKMWNGNYGLKVSVN